MFPISKRVRFSGHTNTYNFPYQFVFYKSITMICVAAMPTHSTQARNMRYLVYGFMALLVAIHGAYTIFHFSFYQPSSRQVGRKSQQYKHTRL
jgi:hypothetical protein